MNTHDIQTYSVAQMLEKLSVLWSARAAVNNKQPSYSELAFDPGKNDFCESLLPFRNHPAWIEASPEMKSTCLSYAWIIYNLKTIYIECDIVTPACEDIIKTPPSATRNRALLQESISEALLDEALHTKMSVTACNYIYHHRDLAHLNFTDFNLIKWKNWVLSSCSAEWERRLTRFGIACASETLITDYLKTLAEDSSVQSICHQVTKTHAMDEWSHSSVFSYVAADLISTLSQHEKTHLKAIIKKTVSMFANNEMGAWEMAFSHARLPRYADIIHDTATLGEVNVYTESVDKLLSRIGLEETH